VAVGDLNGDGFLDIVEGNWEQQNMVYLNDGEGGFNMSSSFGNSDFTVSIALGDLNADGFLDIVTGNGGQNVIYLNDGDGGFTTGSSFIGRNTFIVLVGDLNADGLLDIIEGNSGPQNVVYLNDGEGGFTTSSLFGGTNNTESVALGDLNGDGFLDIVEGNLGQQNVSYLNDGEERVAEIRVRGSLAGKKRGNGPPKKRGQGDYGNSKGTGRASGGGRACFFVLKGQFRPEMREKETMLSLLGGHQAAIGRGLAWVDCFLRTSLTSWRRLKAVACILS
jgi:hypothetical protein